MSSYILSSIEEESFFTVKDSGKQWLIYWLKVSGISEIRELSFDTNIFLDQIIEGTKSSREGMVVHEFNREGDHLKTRFTAHEKGKTHKEINNKLFTLFEEMELKQSPIVVNGLDTIHQRIHFELIDVNGIYSLQPKGLSWKGGEPFIEAVS